jgi:outer membrane lipoprotein-sorting protein
MRGQKHRFWVDKYDFTVWKSVDTSVSPEGHRGVTLTTTVTVTTKQMVLNPSLEDSNFVFTPPDNAKRVDSLKMSGNNPFY